MKNKELLLISAYLLNEEIRLEREFKDNLKLIRYRSITYNDIVELAYSMQKLEDFQEFSKNIRSLLDI